MAEIKLPRLLKAASEFNIGQDTLTDFLVSKGFSRDDLKPTSKLTEPMYHALQQQFQSDKVAKQKSDQVELVKNVSSDGRKRKEEEVPLKKEEKQKPEEAPHPEVIEEPTPQPEIQPDPDPNPVFVPEPLPAEPIVP